MNAWPAGIAMPAHASRREPNRSSQRSVKSEFEVYRYHQHVLDALSGHGLSPGPDTSPQQLRDATRDLYKYEIRRLRDRFLAREFPKTEFAGRVVALRERYWLLSVPLPLWTLNP